MSSAVTALMVAVEFMEVALSTTNKAAMTKGMSQFVFTVYSNATAIFILLPSTFIFYRNRTFPPLTLPVIFRIFILGLVSCSVQMCLNTGIKYGSPTLTAAIVDLVPAFTFLLAVFSRMEKLELKSRSSQAKSIGTVVSIAGALIVTLYKGQPITVVHSKDSSLNVSSLSLASNWVIGGIFSAAGALSLSFLYIVQTWIIKDYPEELIVTLVACIFVTVQSAIVSLIAERNPNAWTLKPDLELMTIVSSAFFAVTIRSVVHTWACRKKGPVYTTMFKPLGMVIAMALGVAFLGDTLYVGSVIGGITIAFGFYSVLWGKAQEENMANDEGSYGLESCSPEVPFLQSKSIDI